MFEKSLYVMFVTSCNPSHFKLQVGTWTNATGLEAFDNIRPKKDRPVIVTDFFNKTFIVTTVMAEPYSMYKSQPNLTGNDRYEGYAIGRCCFVESNTAFVNRCTKPGHHHCVCTQTAEISC